MKYVLLAALSVILLTACKHDVPFAYKMDVQQGNVLDPKKIDQIKVGMTRPEIEQVLGATISRDTFQQTRWDYVYYFKKNHKPLEERRLVMFFDGQNVLKKLENVASSRDVALPPWDQEGVFDRFPPDQPLSETSPDRSPD